MVYSNFVRPSVETAFAHGQCAPTHGGQIGTNKPQGRATPPHDGHTSRSNQLLRLDPRRAGVSDDFFASRFCSAPSAPRSLEFAFAW